MTHRALRFDSPMSTLPRRRKILYNLPSFVGGFIYIHPVVLVGSRRSTIVNANANPFSNSASCLAKSTLFSASVIPNDGLEKIERGEGVYYIYYMVLIRLTSSAT